jgi:hypothetical protein
MCATGTNLLTYVMYEILIFSREHQRASKLKGYGKTD